MTSPSIITLQQKLSTTSSLLLERSRVLSLSLSPSASSQNQIVRNLTVIKNELDKLFSAAGGAGTTGKGSSGSKVKTKGGDMDQQVEEMAEQYDRLLDLFAEDEVGREKGKALRRAQREPTPPPQLPSPTPDLRTPSSPPISANTARPSSSTPTKARPQSRNMPYKDDSDDDVVGFGQPNHTDGAKNPFADHSDDEGLGGGQSDGQMMTSQRMMMEDQDERLNVLSQSIGRQNHLSIQIGTELDEQNELIEDVDGAMDRTTERLGRARRRLDHFAHDAKQHGSLLTIVGLIVILLLLIIVFKT